METSNFTLNSQMVNSSINNFFNKFKISRIAYRCGMRKKDGIPTSTILLTLFSLSFFKKNSYQFFSQKDAPFKKDALYSLLNSPNISWRLFLHKIALVILSFFSKIYTKEYRFLCLGWSDGTSFIPVDFAILASKPDFPRNVTNIKIVF